MSPSVARLAARFARGAGGAPRTATVRRTAAPPVARPHVVARLTSRLVASPLALAVLGVAAGMAVSLALQPIVRRSSLVLLLVATAVVTWRGGWRAGAASSVLSVLAADVLIQRRASIGEGPAADLLLLLLLGAGGAVLTWLVSALHVARERAEAASRAKSEFLNTMSHELRTPLNAIVGYTELIELGVYGPVTAQQLDALARIRASQRYLLDLVNSVLSLAKLDAGGVTFALAPVPVDRVVATAETMVLAQCALAGLTYARGRGPPGVYVWADERKLDQILVNLLGNACKFTTAPGEVTISWEADAERVLIHVADTGRGIEAEMRETIFEPFVQIGASGARGTPHGTGLGLAISRQLARGMGGDVRVASAPGVGSRFTVALPRAPVAVDARTPRTV